jgi:molybdopterin/thiamine biosynthesis adenylyltransferase
MQNSKVLYLHVTGSSSEVLKNLCLAGISAAICDPRPASVLFESPCFFTPSFSGISGSVFNDNEKNHDEDGKPTKKKIKYGSVAEAVRPMVEELNPLLGSCPIVSKDISSLTGDDLKGFTIVISSQVSIDEMVRISKLVSKHNGCVFYTIDCFGMRGVSTIDFGKIDFTYIPEQGKKLLDPTTIKDYVPLSSMVQIPLSKCINRFHKVVGTICESERLLNR